MKEKAKPKTSLTKWIASDMIAMEWAIVPPIISKAMNMEAMKMTVANLQQFLEESSGAGGLYSSWTFLFYPSFIQIISQTSLVMSQIKNLAIYLQSLPSNQSSNVNPSIINALCCCYYWKQSNIIFPMEAYNLLLKEFDESRSSKNFIPQYKGLLDELNLAKKQNKAQLVMKQDELAGSRKNHECFQENSGLWSESGKLEQERLVTMELEKQLEGLRRQINSLKIKTKNMQSQATQFDKKQPIVQQLRAKSGFQATQMSESMRFNASRQQSKQKYEDHVIRKLRSRRQRIKDEIKQILKNKKAADLLKLKWKKTSYLNSMSQNVGLSSSSKSIRNPSSEVAGILHTLDILTNLADNAEQGKQVTIEELQQLSRKSLSELKIQRNMKSLGTLVNKLTRLFRSLEGDSNSLQRANNQATENLRQLQNADQRLNNQICELCENKQTQGIKELQKQQNSLNIIEEELVSNCSKIAAFSTKLYGVLRKVHGAFQTLENTLDLTEQGRKKIGFIPLSKVLLSYEQFLFRNQEETLLKWIESQGQQLPFYKQMIKPNDLLRFYSTATQFSSFLMPLQNYEKITTCVLKKAHSFIEQLFSSLREHLRMAKIKTGSQTIEKQTDSYYCIQSRQYYRRDDLRVQQRLDRQQLRKKGLLVQVPWGIQVDEELNDDCPSKLRRNHTATSTASPRFSFKKSKFSKNKHHQQSLKLHGIRQIFSRLNQTARTVNKPFNHLKSLQQLNSSRGESSRVTLNLQTQRRTVGVLRRYAQR